jgi:hypothetical protein
MWLGLLFLLIVGAGKKWSLDPAITSEAAALLGPAFEEGPLGSRDEVAMFAATKRLRRRRSPPIKPTLQFRSVVYVYLHCQDCSSIFANCDWT